MLKPKAILGGNLVALAKKTCTAAPLRSVAAYLHAGPRMCRHVCTRDRPALAIGMARVTLAVSVLWLACHGDCPRHEKLPLIACHGPLLAK